MESKVVVPAEGQKITLQNGKLNVPHNPIIPFKMCIRDRGVEDRPRGRRADGGERRLDLIPFRR